MGYDIGSLERSVDIARTYLDFFAFTGHSSWHDMEGGRQTSQTVRAALELGFRFGFVASSDSHSGFPGIYGEGLVAVLSEGLDSTCIVNAINALFWKWRAPPIPSSMSARRPDCRQFNDNDESPARTHFS